MERKNPDEPGYNTITFPFEPAAYATIESIPLSKLLQPVNRIMMLLLVRINIPSIQLYRMDVVRLCIIMIHCHSIRRLISLCQ